MTGDELEAKIRKEVRTRTHLKAMWERIAAAFDREESTIRGWESGKAFEYFILCGFELDGARVKYPFEVKATDVSLAEVKGSIEQIDGCIYSEHSVSLVESKSGTSRSEGVESLAKMRNQLLRRPAGIIGSIFALNGFSPGARLLCRFMQPQTIRLWGRRDIEWAVSSSNGFTTGLRLKLDYAMSHGIPEQNLEEY